MKITIICVGSIKENYLKEAIKEYSKRISKFASLEIIELKDESNKMDEESIKRIEGERIISKLPQNSYVIMCDLGGKLLSSVDLANKISDIYTYNSSNIVFLIGGSLGFSKEVYSYVDFKLCFSNMTFPHQLMRVILLEQIYRSLKIINNESYHK